ncbi:helix-turn-helix transcriptional regulator [Mycolicibacterium thermoresistibile]
MTPATRESPRAADQPPRRATMTTMDSANQSGRDDPTYGLGPTRARVLALLQDAGDPMTAATIGVRLGLHANSIRFHLDALTTDGLVVRHREERASPGRPRVLYAAARSAPPVARRSYRLLAEVLTVLLIETLPDPAAAAERAGRSLAGSLRSGDDPVPRPREQEALQTLVGTLDRIGFESRVVDEPNSLRLEVSHCPFLEVAMAHHDVVCAVHLGLIRGILERVHAPVGAETLEPLVEPSRCIAHLTRRRAVV